jgi:proline dehydrogenase
MALEFEINGWKSFREALPSEKEREAFDELMDMCRSNGMAGSNACNPIVFEPMTMSILLAQQQKLRELEQKFNEAVWVKICAQENNPKAPEKPRENQPEMKSKL